jgi:Transposase DDE domain
MPSPTPAAKQLLNGFAHSLDRLRSALRRLDVEAIARRSGFLRRRPRKIPMVDLALALMAAGAESVLSLERVAHWIGLAAHTSYSKQAFHKRLGPQIEPFLAEVTAGLFQSALSPLRSGGWLAPFRRVLLHDSTTQALPPRLAPAFPGPANASAKTEAALKIQCVSDLLQGSVVHLSLSGFRRNDQSAAADILSLARPGDLILRDLGYFSLQVLAQLQALGAFFLTRWRRDLIVRDPRTGQVIPLAKRLRQEGCFDSVVWVGHLRLPLRLVALAVPQELANLRRHRARTNRDRRLKPSRQDLAMMSWNIFLTNVEQALWPAQVLAQVYRLRWRVELIFKTWKSHLGLRALNVRSADLLRLSALSKLLFCALMLQGCATLQALCSPHRQVSLLRVARALAPCSVILSAMLLGISPELCLLHDLQRHLFYEQRSDRMNFYQQLRSANRCTLG